VFQDTNASFNPRKTVARALRETLALRGVPRSQRPGRAAALLDMVGLGGFALARYPHQLSGGQRQRTAIARALAMEPEFLLADEPVASLDVSLQAQIVNLLLRLREDLGLTMLFISHDLALVNHISTRVAVMYSGRIVEIGRPEEVLREPAHPYTRALIDAVPKGIDGRIWPREPVRGAPPDPASLPRGCRFAARCPQAMPVCRVEYPARTSLSTSHAAECHLLAAARPG
jgi:oligopeptide transport system ATP-binding protein